LAALIPGKRAAACGGFFCNQPQNPDELPVAQTGENVLFAMSRTPSGTYQLEAHVQIAYTGPADRFSWVVPVDAMPALDVGSDTVFSQLLSVTEPRFAVAWKEEGTCIDIPPPDAGPPRDYPTAPGSRPQSPPPSSGPSPTPPPGVDVSFRGDVGPYDASIIKSTDASNPKPLLDWLAENKYFVSPQAGKLIADYVREEKLFVAIRLISGVTVKQIQPLVMRFEGPGPCIPLRLTAIAALSDLQINLWVLGDHRVVPQNFYEMQLNEAALNWLPGIGRTYDEVIKQAANEAGGNAFVTDYSGPASIMKGLIYGGSRYRVDQIAAAATPPDALDWIGSMGFPRDSRLMDILRTFIPEPAVLKQMNVSEVQFYNNLRSYWMQYMAQFAPFEAPKLAAALQARFIDPLRKAQELFDGFPTLTRLRTFISPEEMSVDPTFVMNTVLPPVPLQRTAKAYLVCGDRNFTRCEAPIRLELPGGGLLWLKPQPQSSCSQYDTRPNAFEGEVAMKLPALDIGWKRDETTMGVARLDNHDRIIQMLSSHNAAVIAYSKGSGCGCNLGGAAPTTGGAAALLAACLALASRRRARRRR
jgi:hypothetical protein